MRIFVKLDDIGRIKYCQPENVKHDDEGNEIPISFDGYFDATEALKGYTQEEYPYIVFEGGKAVYRQDLRDQEEEEQRRIEEEMAAQPTPQQEIETLKAENAELKKYVELISDSVVDLAMRTLKEV